MRVLKRETTVLPFARSQEEIRILSNAAQLNQRSRSLGTAKKDSDETQRGRRLCPPACRPTVNFAHLNNRSKTEIIKMNDTLSANATSNASEYPCHGATPAEMARYQEIVYWVDGIGQILIGCTGIVGNCLAIPVLISKRLKSIFNRILVFLAIFDNIFIFCAVLEGIRYTYGFLFHNWRRPTF